jgi:dimethylglycine dehydrogenase
MAINYHRTGSIRLAHTKQRMEEFCHVYSMARALGIAFEILTPEEIKTHHPFCETHDILGGLWDPDDGDIDPSQVTQALATGARNGGAQIYRFNPVHAITRTPGGEWVVHSKDGAISCEIVVNAGGYRANEIAAMVGVQHPIISMEHQYLVTEPIPELETRGEARLPLLRDPDISYYLRQERHGLILGPYEKHCKAWAVDGVPPEFCMELLADDLERLEPYTDDAMKRVPLLAGAGIQRVINGPIPYTPDGFPLIGPVYNLPNFHACAAFSFGIVQGGGAGKTAAEIIVHGQAEWDSWFVDPRRYTGYANKRYALEKAIELYSRD